MIIQCEQCRTKFRLDDSKVKDNGVKVRCAKCRHVFTVRKEQPDTVQPSDFEVILDRTPAFSEATPPDESLSQHQESIVSDSQRQQDVESSFSAAQVKPTSIADMDFSAFGADDAQPAIPHSSEETVAFTPGEVDFGDLDFSETDTTTKPSSFDKPFSTDEIDFGIDPTAAPLQQEKPEKSKNVQEFIFTAPEEPQASTSQPAAAKPAPVEPPPIPPVVPQPEIKPAPAQPGIAEPDFGRIPPAIAEGELPPLGISSRRKRSSLFKVLVVLLVVAIIGALGYYGKDLYLRLRPQAAQEAGKITLRSINSTFVKNTITGSELLVISGEAVNSFTAPRAALQVKGIVYGDNSQILVSKNVYCGNPLSAEQLATMPLDAIEAAMANQLGSALMNLEVAPGKAIPFTVVITTVPAGAKDFGVEPAGSQAVPEKAK